jgi:lysophospholipase L1-like esterase
MIKNNAFHFLSAHLRRYFYLTFLISLFSFTIAFSQENLPEFIDLNYNRIVYPGDSTSFMDFFRKIDELQMNKRKKVSVIHYGGSHVQAGYWDEAFQENLQNTITKFDGGGVWTFPFKLGNANTPPFYMYYSTGSWKRCRSLGKEACTDFGMNGITVSTIAATNDFAVALHENFHHRTFKTARVYHNFNNGYNFKISQGIESMYQRRDFPTMGYSQFEFRDPLDSIAFELSKRDTLDTTRFVLYGISLISDEPGFYYADMGFNGASTQSYIDAIHLESQLKTLEPDLVIFSIGVNDTHGPNFSKNYFVTNYDLLVERIKRVSPNCAILFTTVTDNYIRRKTPNRNTLIAHEAILELAKKHNAAYWDMFKLMGGFKSMSLWVKAQLANRDKVHFTSKGYRIMGNLMFEAFNKSYNYSTSLKK